MILIKDEDEGILIFCDNRLSGRCPLEATGDNIVMSRISGIVNRNQ